MMTSSRHSCWCLLLLLWTSIMTASTALGEERYIVTIDAGSSGSRIHVHKVSEPTADQPIPQILSSINQKIKPGLSTFQDSAGTVGSEHVDGLVKFAYDHVPAEFWGRTPIYLKATAGMRSIPRDKSDEVMAVVRASLSGTGFLFDYDWAKVISGVDEAKYSWIATNYLNGKLHSSKDDKLGVLEMGGASLQISYPVPTSTPVNDDNHIIAVELGAQTYHLFAHSFLGYGLDAAQELLHEKQPDKVAACYPPGLTTSKDIAGAGDYPSCYQAMDSILGTATCPVASEKQQERCSIQGKMLPHWDAQKIQFVAIENFYYTTAFFTGNDNTLLSELPSKGQSYCADHWDALKQQYESEREDAFALQRYCFSAAYIMALMDKGFGISLKDQNIRVAHTVGDTDIDWAVGSVVHDVLQLHHNQHPAGGASNDKTDTSTTTPLWMARLLAPVGLVLLVGLIIARRREKKYRLSH